MKRILVSLFLLLLTSQLSYAESSALKEDPKTKESITKLPYRPLKVYKIQTAIGFVTTFDFGEEVEKVYLGDSDYFQAEVYGNQVILKPTVDAGDAETNLTIFTQKHRLSFSVTVGAPHSADLVLEFKEPYDAVFVENAYRKRLDEEKGSMKQEYEIKAKELEDKFEKSYEEKSKETLKELEMKPLKLSRSKDGIKLSLNSISHLGNKSYLRFTISNTTGQSFLISQVVFGAKEEKTKGIREIPSSISIPNEVPSLGIVKGLISFDKNIFQKSEKAFIKLIEKDGQGRTLEISSVNLE